MDSARLSLQLLLSDLANRGLSLWCVERTPIGVLPNYQYFDLPVGTTDVLNLLYRTATTLTGSTVSGVGYQGLQLDSSSTVNVVKVMPVAAVTGLKLYVDSSDDGVTWNNITVGPTRSVGAGEWYCIDLPNTTEAVYWRVRVLTGALASLSQLVFANNILEVPMTIMDRDTFDSMPNKGFTVPAGSRSMQYWFDKQVNPRFWIWPVSGADTDQFLAVTQRQIQDVTSYTQTIEIPQRWQEGIMFLLASRVALELPPEELPPGRLEYLDTKAEQHLVQAEDSENDGAPIRISPVIRGYSA